jgi:hypothetical protein
MNSANLQAGHQTKTNALRVANSAEYISNLVVKDVTVGGVPVIS